VARALVDVGRVAVSLGLGTPAPHLPVADVER
jgi:hypothetical protein